jgi:hypothetical protein
MALRRQVVDFVGLGFLDDADQVSRVGQVAMMQEEARIGVMWILIDRIDSGRIERRGATLDAMDVVVLVEQ